jgi:hypothetical protein
MGICESSNPFENNDKSRNKKVLNNNGNNYTESLNHSNGRRKINSLDIENNNCPKLQRYERSLEKKSEIIPSKSEFSSKEIEEEIIIKGEINKECPNKEKDFNNNSFKMLIKDKGGIILNEDVQSIQQSNDKNANKSPYIDFENENISEIYSQNSLATYEKSKKSEISLFNGKGNKNDLRSEISKSKFTYNSINQKNLNLNKNFINDNKSTFTNKTCKAKINLNNYLNGIFNNNENIKYNAFQNKNHLLNNNKVNDIMFLHSNKLYNFNKNEKDSLLKNCNNMTNSSTKDDLMGSFISIPKNDEKIPEFHFGIHENGEDIISCLSSEK